MLAFLETFSTTRRCSRHKPAIEVGITDLGANIPHSTAREADLTTDVVLGMIELDSGS